MTSGIFMRVLRDYWLRQPRTTELNIALFTKYEEEMIPDSQ